MPSKLTLRDWRSAVEGAATEIATHALSFRSAVVLDRIELAATAMIGAHIPLVGGGQAFDLALVSSAQGCDALARAILGLGAGSAIREAEIVDAIGEIANMLAGATKRRLAGPGAHLALGLPIFVRGYLQPRDRMPVIELPIRFGSIDSMVLIAGAR